MHRLLLAILCVSSLSLSAADLTQARQLIAEKRVPEARPLLETALAAEPENLEIMLLLGPCQMDMQDWVSAVRTYEKAMEHSPDRADVLVPYGIVCLRQAGAARSLSLAKKGRAALEAALVIDPSIKDARHALVSYYSQAPWFAGGDMDKACAHAEALKKVDPDAGLLVLANLKSKAGKYDEVFSLCEQALAGNPDNYFALYEFGRASSLSGLRTGEGLKALQKCASLPVPPHAPGHAGVYYRMGLIHQKDKQAEEARRCFEEALRLEPKNQNFIDQVKKAQKS